MNPFGPAMQEKADMIRFMSQGQTMVTVEDNLQSHMVALLAIMADPDALILVPDSMKESIHFFNMYNINTAPPNIEVFGPVTEYGCALKDEDKGDILYHPLDSMTLEEVEQWYLTLEHSNLLPY